MKEFQTAAEEWPGNPDLNTSANSFFKSENTADEATGDFDRLEKDANFAQRSSTASWNSRSRSRVTPPASSSSRTRSKKSRRPRKPSKKANAMAIAGDVDGAWETVELAAKDWPDDVKLNKLLAQFSEQGADFVSAVNKAREAESKKETRLQPDVVRQRAEPIPGQHHRQRWHRAR